ncbi:MAG: hypothetical protein SH808_06260 [Saprospiraceae bacterium]|nr:hypothetical protein [Saprospiraceae bacterium]
MKKSRFQMLTVMLAFTLFAGWGCYNDAVIYPAGDFKGEVSFTGDVIPIFNADCNTSGCHNPGGIKPDLSPANAYISLTTVGYINTGAPEESELYRWMKGLEAVPMPPSGSDALNTSIVLAWIQQGALEN